MLRNFFVVTRTQYMLLSVLMHGMPSMFRCNLLRCLRK